MRAVASTDLYRKLDDYVRHVRRDGLIGTSEAHATVECPCTVNTGNMYVSLRVTNVTNITRCLGNAVINLKGSNFKKQG